MKKICMMTLLTAAMLSLLAVGAQAADYDIETDGTPEYYGSTSYADVYGSQYNYAGKNTVDYQAPELEYGTLSTTQTGVMEKGVLPGLQANVATGAGGYGAGGGITVQLPEVPDGGATDIQPMVAFTKLTKDFYLSNGAVGRISIPAIGIKKYNVWEGETSASMKKGVAHFSSTSVWDGNVCICGHNRGATYVIGAIKDLERGDKITYTTTEGTRTYEVRTVKTIGNDDWTYLQPTTDNRITLITCVAGDSSRRWCVQAVEID